MTAAGHGNHGDDVRRHLLGYRSAGRNISSRQLIAMQIKRHLHPFNKKVLPFFLNKKMGSILFIKFVFLLHRSSSRYTRTQQFRHSQIPYFDDRHIWIPPHNHSE